MGGPSILENVDGEVLVYTNGPIRISILVRNAKDAFFPLLVLSWLIVLLS